MVKVIPPPNSRALLASIAKDPERLFHILRIAKPVDHKGRYLPWDELRHRQPPDDLTLEEWWFATAHQRLAISRFLPFEDKHGRPFRFSNVDPIQAMVHRIDKGASGRIGTGDALTAIQSRDRYLLSSLIAEEAINSSILEGAATTRKVAKEMLQADRRPRDRSERMILNNYRVMQEIARLANEGTPLTPDVILELHRIVTDETLTDPADAGRFQQSGEARVMVISNDNKVLHEPPPAAQLPERIERLCAFANGEDPTASNDQGFLHPVVRAILVHFMLGYDHPFADGNGRTARALFYYSMLRSGYWLAQYFSISTILREAPAQYMRAYLHAETDDNDSTYFVIHQLHMIERAIKSLDQYIARKTTEVAEVERLALLVPSLNHRQIAVINAAHRSSDTLFTIREHQKQHRVTYQTARTDLLDLEQLGLLTRVCIGRQFEFRNSGDLPAVLRSLSKT